MTPWQPVYTCRAVANSNSGLKRLGKVAKDVGNLYTAYITMQVERETLEGWATKHGRYPLRKVKVCCKTST